LSIAYDYVAETTPQDGLTVFNYLAGDDGQIRGQCDRLPSGGAWFTGSWLPGEIVADQQRFPTDSSASLGSYILYVGLHTTSDGQRRPTFLNGPAQADDGLPLNIITAGI
jgi:hypothetical protein